MRVIGWILIIWGVLAFAGLGSSADGSFANTSPLFGAIALVVIGVLILKFNRKKQ